MADRTPGGRASVDDPGTELLATAQARLAASPVAGEFVLIAALRSVGVDIVPKGRAAMHKSGLECSPDRDDELIGSLA